MFVSFLSLTITTWSPQIIDSMCCHIWCIGIDTKSVSAPAESYAEVDATKFKIRGPDYLTSKGKINAAPAGT